MRGYEVVIAIVAVVGTLLAVVALINREKDLASKLSTSAKSLKTYDPPAPPANHPHAAEQYWAYYELQYQRIASTESYRLQVTNFVAAGSVVALGLLAGTEKGVNQWVTLVAGLAVVSINLFAIAFSMNSRKWVKIHQARAATVLKAVSESGLVPIQEKVEAAFGIEASSGRMSLLRSNLVLSYMHGVLAVAAAALLGIALLEPKVGG